MSGPLSSKEERNNEAYDQGYHDARNTDDPIARLGNSIARDIGKSDEAECYRSGYDKGCEDRAERGSQDDSSSSSEKSGCFLTTACVAHAGLPDNCHELTILRRFRDTHLLANPRTRTLVDEYYRRSPTLVSRISSSPTADLEFADIFKRIRTIVDMIEDGRSEDAVNHYQRMFNDVSERHGQ